MEIFHLGLIFFEINKIFNKVESKIFQCNFFNALVEFNSKETFMKLEKETFSQLQLFDSTMISLLRSKMGFTEMCIF